MQAHLTALTAPPSLPASRFFTSAQPPCDESAAAHAGSGLAVESSALLQGNKAVSIVHNGAIYRLQSTKLGKLILTK